MTSNYHYLYSSLPEIFFDEKRDFRELAFLFDDIIESLSDEDKSAMRYVRYPIDNINLMILLKGKPDAERRFIPGGNFTIDELKNEINSTDSIPSYIYRFLELYNMSQVEFGDINHIDLLNEKFFDEIMALEEGTPETNYEPLYDRPLPRFDGDFIKRWYVFERDFNNVLTAIECLKHNEPIERRETVRVEQRSGRRLSGDYDVTDALRQSKSYDFSLSGMLPWMAKILNLNSENIQSYEKELVLIKLDTLDELAGDDIFSLNTLLAYFIKLQILIRWSSLDETSGKNFVDNLSQRVMSYTHENHG
jgi:vacuolar-type H+-ATPase subunit C/Vma6